jgi:hypothetical protein
MTEDQIAAMQVRLQVAHNALQGIAGPLEDWRGNLRHGQLDEADADAMQDQLNLVRAALAILRGVRSDIPDALKMSTIGETEEKALRTANPGVVR